MSGPAGFRAKVKWETVWVRAGSRGAQGLKAQARQGFGRGLGPKLDPIPRPTQKLHKRPESP